MHTDPIADMLTRIRNAQAVKKSEVILPYSKLKFNIAKKLATEGWLGTVDKLEPRIDLQVKKFKGKKNVANRFDQIRIKLIYQKDGQPKINDLTRISKPGRRVYVSKDELPTVLNDLGIAVISTSKGLLTNREAKKQKLGGEVICQVY